MIISRPALYVVGTPIGNLEDISPRALFVLKEADFIAAEDTRVTLKLLNRFGIKNELISYHEHNAREHGEIITGRLERGQCAALCSDAGMPAISDPGQLIALACSARGIPVLAVPGPSAHTAALAVSGIPSGRFCFEGFLSTAKKNRREHLLSLRDERRTMVFYEAPHKLLNTLSDMYEVFGDRGCAICRELTKLHETCLRTTLSGALESYRESPPRGEFVLVVEGAAEEAPEKNPAGLPAEYERALALGLCKKDALKEAARSCGLSRNEAYAALNPSGGDDGRH